MSTLEDGTWEKPPRPRKKEDFVPIEEVSEEDLHPDFISSPPTPEEELMAKQAEAAELNMEITEEYPWVKKEKDAEYWSWLDAVAREYENRTDPHEDVEAFLTRRYPHSKKEDMERDAKELAIALRKHKGTYRSPEEKGKYPKGQETIRKDGHIDGFRWSSKGNGK